MTKTDFRLPESWPAPYDQGAAERLIERFTDIGAAEAHLADQPAVGAMLSALGGNSAYLADLAVREAATVRQIVERGPGSVVDEALTELAAVSPANPRPRIAQALRKAKRIIALATAIADIGAIWRLERITAALSDLAERALALSVAHLLRSAHDAGELRLPYPDEPARGGGFTVLGMGKLGARELNYSSDVDLVLLYDPGASIYTERTAGYAMGAFMSRMARALVALMEARDSDGYVFRTDLRLRPDPAATPPALAMVAAITYYESMGQNWERAAMIKARPVAGDLALGAEFLEAIRPFVWRRGLDFAAVTDIQAMKRRIDQHRGGALGPAGDAVERIAGHNVKLGQGGIREIEFLTQTLQLVWGGRDPGLRAPTTLGALRLLASAGLIARAAAAELASAYRFLRRVEHRLQMIADRQVHTLPERPAEMARFATFMGYSDVAAFAQALLRQLGRVRARYAEVVEEVPTPPGEGSDRSILDFSGADAEPPETAARLRELGFQEPARIVSAVRAWQAGHVRALRSSRSQEIMAQMLPALLAALGRQAQPDVAFARFDSFISRQPAGVQLLSLFQRNPLLLDRIANVLGAAPTLADHLARHPRALDGLLSLEEEPDPSRQICTRLQDARLLEDVIEITRRSVREADFSISVATMEGRMDADVAGEQRSELAAAALAALLPRVLADFAERFGGVRGGGMAVVAMGKCGGREMMAGSDLDLMLIYDHPADVSESRGARHLPVSQWFVRAAHSYVAAVTSPGADGQLYAVDMRLRPSGNKGPVAVSLASFRNYHASSAWTWERMALTRARVVAGPAALGKRIEATIADILRNAGDRARILADAAAMRARMARELPPEGPWDVKLRPGGMVDVEFIAQALQLVHARDYPGVCHPTTRVALQRLAQERLLPVDDTEL
ncbi:MAG: bifunctional [glutamine synthetase] adenylyltransferase/[glutamine synthetase]-adenylyl-L-tyrosine phosphorylase, partial [Acetobacteraceae bacterium]|nr:bifunctional [glutamine synthetase] adenylyltransferase/[glutamine synthetase]-adenylyl-L-tyrosine phosphorylase [Acetobacteraceae bacterium]